MDIEKLSTERLKSLKGQAIKSHDFDLADYYHEEIKRRLFQETFNVDVGINILARQKDKSIKHYDTPDEFITDRKKGKND